MRSFVQSTMSNSCQKLQQIAYSALQGAAPSTHIASFGNTDTGLLDEWVPIMGVDIAPPVVSDVTSLNLLNFL